MEKILIFFEKFKLHPNAKIFFSDLSSLAFKLEKEIEYFTAAKQQEAISYAKQKISIFRQVIQFQLEQTNTFFKKVIQKFWKFVIIN